MHPGDLRGLLFAGGIAAIAGLFIVALFLRWAAGILDIESRSYGGALVIVVLSLVPSSIIALLLSVNSPPIIVLIDCSISAFIITLLATLAVFRTSLLKAFEMTVVFFLLLLVVLGGFAGAIALTLR
ncbi:MAG TPA: hypothetical protein PLJ71_18580 [Candidatus Hydrogenedentes bacterium]|nr:hypothetical protein [Candidatus Hydrogenedentota bacterium]HQM50699.1 hypothetical protein [Candidatus Hydrogenedentota bacterium]